MKVTFPVTTASPDQLLPLTEEAKAPTANVVRALDRGVQVLFVVARAGAKLSLEEIAKRVDLSQPTVFRILATLCHHGLVKRDTRQGGYSLGVACVELGGAFSQTIDVVAEARPIMEELATRFGQTVNLGILDRGHVLYLHRVAPPSLLGPMVARPGLNVPATCSGIGKAILAQQDPTSWPIAEVAELPQCTEYSLTTTDRLHTDLRETKARGFAIDLQELAIGVHSAAAPVFDPDGTVTTAMSVGGVRDQLTLERLLDEIGPALTEAASKLSKLIGRAASTRSNEREA